MKLYRKLVHLVAALVAALLFSVGVGSAPTPVSAAVGKLTNCTIWNYATSASSSCFGHNTDPSYNGLQRIKVYCSIGGVHDTVRNGPWVLQDYNSYAACPYPDVRYFSEIQFL